MNTRVREGRTALLLTIFLVATLLLPAILFGNIDSASGQQGQPSPSGTGPAIQLLNPSDYSTFTFNNTTPGPTTVQGPQMSDEDTSDTDAQGQNPLEYHFAAVITNAPSQPFVEFWLIQGSTEFNLGCAGTPSGGGSCEGTFGDHGAVGLVRDIPDEFTEGPPPTDDPTSARGRAVVRAILFANNGQNESARDNQDVVLNQKARPGDPDPRGEADPEAAAETVEILYPTHGGFFGLFQRSGGAYVGVVDVEWSPGTDRIQVLYTVSPTDVDPTWKSCGTDESTGAATATRASAQDGVRCTLIDSDQPGAVTGIAAVARDAETQPPSQPNTVVDNSGDAHRVVGYVQVPGFVNVTDQTLPAARVGGCSDLLVATVTDPLARPIAGIDVDVHIQGPTDQVAFNTFSDTNETEQSSFDQSKSDRSQAPQNHPTETGRRCSNNTRSGNQGVHAVGGGDDRKHIEALDDTDDDGQFMFKLWSDAPGGTRVTAWADSTEDDRFCPDEKSDDATVIWGSAETDPAPPAEGPEPPPCPNPSPSPSGSGSVSPSPTTSPSPTVSPTPTPSGSISPTPSPSGSVSATPTPSGSGTATATPSPTPTPATTGGTTTSQQSSREVTIEASESEKVFGRSFALSGAVTSDNPACTDFVSVQIRRDVVGGSDDFVLVSQEQTDTNGAYSTTLRADRSANYIAQVTETSACDDASSSAQPVLVRVKVILTLSRNSVDRGDRVRLRARTSPCPDTARDRVLLFRAIEGEFGKVGSKRSNGECRATFVRRIRSSSVFQARWPKQSPEFLAGQSRSKAVRVID